MSKGRNGIPDRWDKYSPIGRQIDGTPFVAFKVPLQERFFKLSNNLPAETSSSNEAEASSTSVQPPPNDFNDPWTLKILAERQPNLDVVIDLTFTTKYYKPRDLQTESLKYVKIFSKGHEIPNSQVVRQFFNAVESAQEKNADCLIGVHCTHGVNRTGYFICRYLIQKLNWEPLTAIQAFAEHRGHPIERDLYLRDLERASWKDEVVSRPQKWRSRHDEDDRSHGEPRDDGHGERHGERHGYPRDDHHDDRRHGVRHEDRRPHGHSQRREDGGESGYRNSRYESDPYWSPRDQWANQRDYPGGNYYRGGGYERRDPQGYTHHHHGFHNDYDYSNNPDEYQGRGYNNRRANNYTWRRGSQ